VGGDSPPSILPFDLEGFKVGAGPHFLCGEWPEYLKLFHVDDAVQCIEIAAVAEEALYGMADYCGSFNWELTGTGIPTPLYLRRSTVEERFARGGV
jgi:hypothetical protein